MMSLEAIKAANLRNYPEQRVDIVTIQKELQGDIDRLHGDIKYRLDLLISRAVYNAQLEIFNHFGKSSAAYHKYLEGKEQPK